MVVVVFAATVERHHLAGRALRAIAIVCVMVVVVRVRDMERVTVVVDVLVDNCGRGSSLFYVERLFATGERF